MNISDIIEDLNNRLSKKYSDFKGSYLYGSRAKGNYKDHSDIDVVVLFEKLTRAKDLDICSIVCDVEYKHNVFIDIQTFTPEKLMFNPFYYEEVTVKGVFYAA